MGLKRAAGVIYDARNGALRMNSGLAKEDRALKKTAAPRFLLGLTQLLMVGKLQTIAPQEDRGPAHKRDAEEGRRLITGLLK